tara:strand:+ start:67 stop:2412 length:2346 start_codon:yes stop_codon:yes gene_type:complete
MSNNAQIDLIVERLTNSQGLDDLIESLDAFTDLKIGKTLKQQSGKILIPILSQLLCAEYNDEAVAQRVLSVLVDLCDENNSLLFLSEHATFEVLLDCLAHNNTLVQIHTIELLGALLNFHREKVEQALLSCNLGLRRLMDIVAVGEQVHVKVRNDMLSLLKALTLYNDRIKEFMSFSQGFELLFDIIDQEESIGQLCLDCLGLAKNLLSKNTVTKKMFAQSPVVTRLPELIAGGFLSPTSSSSSSSSSSSPSATTGDLPTNDILTRCQCTVDLILELLSCMGSGDTRINLLTTLSTTESPDPHNMQKMSELKQLQQAICNQNILCSLLQVATVLRSCLGSFNGTANNQNGSKISCEILMTKVLNALAALLCGSSSNQVMFSSSKMVLPWGSQRIVTNVGCLSLILDMYVNIESNSIHAAAFDVLDSFFCLNEDAKISIVGHTIAPPPADLDGQQDQGLPNSESPGRMIVDLFTTSVETLMNATVSTSERNAAQFSFNSACDVLEKMYSNNITCKELLLRVKVSGPSSSASSASSDAPKFFLEHCFRLVRATMVDASNAQGLNASARLMRLVATWTYTSTAVVDTIFQSATHLSTLAGIFKTMDNNNGGGIKHTVVLFSALLLAVCVATGSGGSDKETNAVYGFVDNVLGVEQLHDLLDRALSDCVERNVVAFIKQVRSIATEKLVQRYTMSENGSGGQMRSRSSVSSSEEVEKLRTKIRALEEDKRSSADLFVLLAHLDLENRVLLKHLQMLGGVEALNAAKEEARCLLQLQNTKADYNDR